MLNITTRLTTSGNSKAIRLPKELLRMSELGEQVELEARRGQIIIRKAKNPRASWPNQINKILADQGEPTHEFTDMEAASDDGLDNLPWDGPTYEQWHAKNS